MGVVFPPEPEPDENREVQRRREGGGSSGRTMAGVYARTPRPHRQLNFNLSDRRR